MKITFKKTIKFPTPLNQKMKFSIISIRVPTWSFLSPYFLLFTLFSCCSQFKMCSKVLSFLFLIFLAIDYPKFPRSKPSRTLKTLDSFTTIHFPSNQTEVWDILHKFCKEKKSMVLRYHSTRERSHIEHIIEKIRINNLTLKSMQQLHYSTIIKTTRD